MNLLLDQGLPRSAAQLLSSAGIDTIHVAEVDLAKAEDSEILEAAREQRRVVVTLDADFHALLALTGAHSPSVIRIRIEGLLGPHLASLLKHLINQFAVDLEQGALLTVQPHRTRVRRLPLLRGDAT